MTRNKDLNTVPKPRFWKSNEFCAYFRLSWWFTINVWPALRSLWDVDAGCVADVWQIHVGFIFRVEMCRVSECCVYIGFGPSDARKKGDAGAP